MFTCRDQAKYFTEYVDAALDVPEKFLILDTQNIAVKIGSNAHSIYAWIKTLYLVWRTCYAGAGCSKLMTLILKR